MDRDKVFPTRSFFELGRAKVRANGVRRKRQLEERVAAGNGAREKLNLPGGESVVHFNSSAWNPHFHSSTPLALRSVSSLGFLPFGKSLQNECRRALLAPVCTSLSATRPSSYLSERFYSYSFYLLGLLSRFSTFCLSSVLLTSASHNSSAIRLCPATCSRISSSPQQL